MKAKRSIEISLKRDERSASAAHGWDTASCLHNRKILVANSMAPSGEISEILVHPVRGVLSGVVVKTAAGQFFQAELNAFRPQEQFLILEGAVPQLTATLPLVEKDIAGVRQHLLGATVVTAQGQLLGKIDDLCWREPDNKVYYHITESSLRRLLGNDFWIAGSSGLSWFETERRLIVAPEVEILQFNELSEKLSADSSASADGWLKGFAGLLSSLVRLPLSWLSR